MLSPSYSVQWAGVSQPAIDHSTQKLRRVIKVDDTGLAAC